MVLEILLASVSAIAEQIGVESTTVRS